MALLSYLLSPFTDPNEKTSSQGDSLFPLDGIRGLAAVIVIASHTGAFGMTGQGLVGVLLFFALSGFLLAMPYVSKPSRILSIREVGRFFANRALRIVPNLAAVTLYLKWYLGFSWLWAFQNISFYGGWNHLWSVAEEARFYLLLPFVLAILAVIPFRLLALALAIWGAWRVRGDFPVSMLDGNYYQLYFWLFLAGTFASFVVPLVRPFERYGCVLANIVTAGIVLFIFASSAAAVAVIWPTAPAGFTLSGGWPELWAVLFSVLLLTVAVWPATLVGRLMSSWLMRHLGLLSYSLYLWHVPVLMLLLPYKLDPWAMFLAVFAGTYIVALVVYLAIEKPFLMLKPKRLRLNLKGKGEAHNIPGRETGAVRDSAITAHDKSLRDIGS